MGGSVGDDDLLQQPLPQRPQVGGTVGHGTLGTGCIVYSIASSVVNSDANPNCIRMQQLCGSKRQKVQD